MQCVRFVSGFQNLLFKRWYGFIGIIEVGVLSDVQIRNRYILLQCDSRLRRASGVFCVTGVCVADLVLCRMDSPLSAVAQLDCSIARLFSQLVSLQLASFVDKMDADDMFPDDLWDSQYEGYADKLVLVERRLSNVESSQKKILALLQQIACRMPASAAVGALASSSADSRAAVSSFLSAEQVSVRHNTAPPLAAAAGTQAGSGSSSGSNSTQEGFSFVCSLCLRPQHTPKTHCEHMRRLSENLGNCSLSMSPDLMPDRHRRVLAVFGNPQSFANWCVPHCSICDVSVTNC